MVNRARHLTVGFLMLVLQLGLAHAVQHDLHDFDPTHLHEQQQSHSEDNCLLADTPQAKSALPLFCVAPACQPQHDVPPTADRHSTKHYSKAAPRGPPASL